MRGQKKTSCFILIILPIISDMEAHSLCNLQVEIERFNLIGALGYQKHSAEGLMKLARRNIP